MAESHTVDPVAVDADDALLDVLGSRAPEPAAHPVTDELSRLLAAWRVEVDSRPVAALVSPRRAVRTARRARWSAAVSRLLHPTRRTR